MTLEFEVDDFLISELPELTELWIAAWTQTMPDIDFEQRRDWFVEHLQDLYSKGILIYCLRCFSPRSIVGFLTLDRDSGHIDQLAVDPRFWGQGAAEYLLAHARKLRPSALQLDVNQSNRRAIRFYEKQGFRRRALGVNPTSGLATWSLEWRQD